MRRLAALSIGAMLVACTGQPQTPGISGLTMDLQRQKADLEARGYYVPYNAAGFGRMGTGLAGEVWCPSLVARMQGNGPECVELKAKPTKVAQASEEERLYRVDPNGARYYVLSKKRDGDRVTVIARRDGTTDATRVLYTKTEVDCRSRRFRYIAESDRRQALEGRSSPSRWSSLTSGSSKADLVREVC